MKTLILRLENVIDRGYFPVYVIRQDIRRLSRNEDAVQLVRGRNGIFIWSSGCPEGAVGSRNILFVRGCAVHSDTCYATLTRKDSELVFKAILCPADSSLNRERICL